MRTLLEKVTVYDDYLKFRFKSGVTEGSAVLLGAVSKATNILSTVDKISFVAGKLMEFRAQNLPNALVEGEFQICVYYNSPYIQTPEGADFSWIIPIAAPYSCTTWGGRNGFKDNYLCRYVKSGKTERMRCQVTPFAY